MNFYPWGLALALLFPFASASRAQTVSCVSADYSRDRHYCQADTRFGARLVTQTSSVECVEGKTWGWDEQGIWVDQGCAGQFALGKTDSATASIPGHPPIASTDPPAKKQQLVNCSSSDGRRNVCDADLKGATVRLVREVGGAQCQENMTWGYDDKGIWVDHGCRGEFVVLGQGSSGEASCEKSAGKKEAKKMVEECRQVSPATHPPCNAKNSCVLIQDEIRRSCEWLGKSAPPFCEQYKQAAGTTKP